MDPLCTSPELRECGAEKIVCRCLNVTEAQVVKMIERLELRCVRDVRNMTGAGEGCTCCHGRIQELLEQHACEAAALG